MFLIELKPKGYVFPEMDDGCFQMGNAASSVADLREYLAAAVDQFDGQQQWCYMDDAGLDKYVRVLPVPFNDPDAMVELTWSKEDIVFYADAQMLLDFFGRAFSELELAKLSVDELRLIAAVKAAGYGGSRKADLVESILLNQRRAGLAAVRVVQTSLFGSVEERVTVTEKEIEA